MSASAVTVLTSRNTAGARLISSRDNAEPCCFYTESFYLGVVLTGSSEVLFGGRPYQLDKGTIWLLEPGAIFTHRKLPVRENINLLQIDHNVVEDTARRLGHRMSFVREPFFRSPRG